MWSLSAEWDWRDNGGEMVEGWDLHVVERATTCACLCRGVCLTGCAQTGNSGGGIAPDPLAMLGLLQLELTCFVLY